MQELITGDNSIEKLTGLVTSHGKESVFIITGQHFAKKQMNYLLPDLIYIII